MRNTYRLAAGLLLSAILWSCSGLRLNGPLNAGKTDWPTFAGTATRQGRTDASLVPPLELAWEADITGGIGSGSPLIVDTVLIVGNLRGELHAFSINSGKRIGWVDIGDAIEGAPVINGNIAYVTLSNSGESLVAFDLIAGKPQWKRNYGDLEVSPLFFHNQLCFGNLAGTFFCVSSETGEQQWSFELPANRRQKGIRSTASTDGRIVVFGADDGNVYGLDAASGKLMWQFQTGAPVDAAPSINNGLVHVGNLGGRFIALEIETGIQRWTASFQESIYATATYSGECVIVGTTGGVVRAMRAIDGSTVWEVNVGGVVNSPAVVADSLIYVGTLKKDLIALNSLSGSIMWKTTLGGRIKSGLAIAHGKLFVGTDERNIVAFRGTAK